MFDALVPSCPAARYLRGDRRCRYIERPTEAATHGNVAGNPVAIAQTLHFMETFFSGGTAEILDPYKTLGVKP